MFITGDAQLFNIRCLPSGDSHQLFNTSSNGFRSPTSRPGTERVMGPGEQQLHERLTALYLLNGTRPTYLPTRACGPGAFFPTLFANVNPGIAGSWTSDQASAKKQMVG